MTDLQDDPDDARALALVSDLRAVLSQFKRMFRGQASLGDMTLSQVSVLSRLDRDGPATVTNLARALTEMGDMGYLRVGLDSEAPGPLANVPLSRPLALVLGAEGKGLHDLVKKKCDFLVSIPMLGKVSSLNVSVAGAVVMYEIVRQRRNRSSQNKEASSGTK